MPTYEYECDACSHRFELLQSMSEPAVRKCPKCRKLKVRRLISGGAGFIFKGSGFYETDYKRTRSSSDAAKRSADESPNSDPTPAKPAADDKPAAKPATSKPSKGSGGGSKKKD